MMSLVSARTHVAVVVCMFGSRKCKQTWTTQQYTAVSSSTPRFDTDRLSLLCDEIFVEQVQLASTEHAQRVGLTVSVVVPFFLSS